MTRLVLIASLVGAAVLGSAQGIKRTADPAISPDGSEIAFAYQGDIWLVPSAGGEARRLTVHAADDSFPVWTPDGRRIVFVSTRYGSRDVFSMGRDGGDLRRLTFESSDEYTTTVSPDGRQVMGYTNAWGRLDLFAVGIQGGDIARMTSNSFIIEYYPDAGTDQVVYNLGGSPARWRDPGTSGSNSGEIWVADRTVPLRGFKRLTSDEHDDIFPKFAGKNEIVFVSNRGGARNIWVMNRDGSGKKALTRHDSGTIRYPSVSADGSKVAYQRESAIWLHDRKSGATAPVAITAPADAQRNPVTDLSLNVGVDGFALSPNGKRAVIVVRGDLYLIPEKGGTTRRLTTSPGRDGSPVWLDDSTILYVAAGASAHRSMKTVDLDGNIKEFKSDELDLLAPVKSPDGKWLAYHRGMQELWVSNIKGENAHLVAKSAFQGAPSGTPEFAWSPDSEWLMYQAEVARGVQARLVSHDGSKDTLLVQFGKSLGPAGFMPSGRAIYFIGVQGTNYSELRQSTAPLYILDLVPRPIEFSEDELDKIDAPKAEEPAPGVKILAKGLKDRVRALTTTTASAPFPHPEGKLIVANVDGQFSTVDAATGAVRPVAGVTGAAFVAGVAPNKQKVYLVQARRLFAMDVRSGTVTPIAFAAEARLDLAAEEQALFEEIWWALDRGFYDPKKHGKDWAKIREDFAHIVPHATSREDFYALMAEMVERLESSHQGATAPSSGPTPREETGFLGVEWDAAVLSARGQYIVSRVLPGSAADHPDSELIVGDRLVSVDGKRPGQDGALAALLLGKSGKKVRLAVERGGRQVDVQIRPGSYGSRQGLAYRDWVESNRAMVDRLSGGRLGYIHIQGMDEAGVDTFLKESQTEAMGRDGVVVDVRFNGGGFTGQIILNTMLKTPWLIRTVRDLPGTGYSENIWRGNALELPAVCLINQYSFSNAEIFAEGFRRLNLGPVVGERTAGGVIGTSAWGLWDGGQIRMPSSGAYAIDGENLERNGRKPDYDVRYDPSLDLEGRDPQIERAVVELLKRLK